MNLGANRKIAVKSEEDGGVKTAAGDRSGVKTAAGDRAAASAEGTDGGAPPGRPEADLPSVLRIHHLDRGARRKLCLG